MKEMPRWVFSKIIDELVTWKFDKPIFLHRHNEPLANMENITRCIREIREKLPRAKIGINTNGDFVWDGLDFDYLTVTDYDNKLKEYCNEDEGVRVMKLKNLCNRAGTLQHLNLQKRCVPCFEPERSIVIDYTGDVSLCCNMRFECVDHREFYFGNVEHSSLSYIYFSTRADVFRKRVKEMDFPSVCKYCVMRPGRFARENPRLGNDMEDYV